MVAHPTANPELLLDDDDDRPVPIGTGPMPLVPSAADDTRRATAQAMPPGELAHAAALVASPFPLLGVRALVFALTGVNLRPSRSERDLRLSFCALYRASHDQSNPAR